MSSTIAELQINLRTKTAELERVKMEIQAIKLEMDICYMQEELTDAQHKLDLSKRQIEIMEATESLTDDGSFLLTREDLVSIAAWINTNNLMDEDALFPILKELYDLERTSSDHKADVRLLSSSDIITFVTAFNISSEFAIVNAPKQCVCDTFRRAYLMNKQANA